MSAASAATPTTVTQVTHIVNRPDGGNGGTWAYDSFTRTLTVAVAATQNPADAAAGKTDYVATVVDNGGFSSVQGTKTPNQVTAGALVAHAVKGTMSGGISYTVVAPSTDNLVAPAGPVVENDNFAAPAGNNTTAQWPAQVFANPALAVVTENQVWSWTYATACESWTDSAINGDGNLAADGNITGRICPVPVLYGGHAVFVAATRENVSYKQTLTAWDKFVIVGPGAINGHQGWVHGQGGGVENTGVYSGLLPNHGYTVLYTPVTGQGSNRQIIGTHTGYVFFVSNQPTP
jgi:hypothetical protein